MRWSNAFSYGKDNFISFDKNPITQLVGRNGHGKSSIALILEEALFNKNSKGVKKASILNRYGKSKSYEIEVEFDCDGDAYKLTTNRGSTQSASLTKNGTDISAHTSTGTYKLVEEILGYDHKTFTQIVYQSDPFSLEFLTATDTARKKFLIDLLNLSNYSRLNEYFKEQLKEATKNQSVVQAKLDFVKNWLTKFNSQDTSIKATIEVPAPDLGSEKLLLDAKSTLRDIQALNAKIEKNNQYKKMRDAIQIMNIDPYPYDTVDLSINVSELQKQHDALDRIIKGTGPIYTKCPSCGQTVDNSHKQKMLEEAKEGIAPIKQKLAEQKELLEKAKAHQAKIKKAQESQSEWEKYHSLIDNSLKDVLHNKSDIEAQIEELTKKLEINQKAIREANNYNAQVEAHNAKSQVLIAQKAETEADAVKYQAELNVINDRLAVLQVLVKTFSPSGLVAYKIEVLVKDLEKLVNEYLQELSGGRFQLSFRLSQGDKLDVVITDNGKDIDISALSNGELARVNVSTLLAIRRLMQTLSNTNTNLLILDETVESLDADGKEKLIEVLLSESHLNTFLVSHGFSHPLLEKVSIVKTNNISRIE